MASVNRDIVVHNGTTICAIGRSVHKDPKLEKRKKKKKKSEHRAQKLYTGWWRINVGPQVPLASHSLRLPRSSVNPKSVGNTVFVMGLAPALGLVHSLTCSCPIIMVILII
jgi:hypothetical protein